jgi:hypothetical protein
MSSGSTTVATNRYEDSGISLPQRMVIRRQVVPLTSPRVLVPVPRQQKKPPPESLRAGSGPLTAHDDAAALLDSVEIFGGGVGEDLEAYCDEWLAQNLARVVGLRRDEPRQTSPPANKEP